MQRGTGLMRRIVAGLLALTLLVLPGMPMRHVAAAQPEPVAYHCEPDAAAMPADHISMVHHQPSADQPGETPSHDQSGMLCCPAAHCPATVAVMPIALPTLLPRPTVSFFGIAMVDQLDGIPVDPALRPPRVA